ncbi:unnamed protein product, partial [Ectocarpus fasciculatus]
MRTTTRLLALLLLGACTPDPDVTRTAVQIQLTADLDVPGDYLDTIELVIDPEAPFADADGVPLEAGTYSSRSVLMDYNTDDADLELVISLGIATGVQDLPSVELQPGLSDGPFTVTAYGFDGDYFTMQSDDLTRLTFTAEEV